MKKLFIAILMLVGASAFCQSTNTFRVDFTWDPNPEPDIAFYNLYERTLPATNYTRVASITNATAATVLMQVTSRRTNGWYLTAVNTAVMESDPSNEVIIAFPTRPGAPRNLKVNVSVRVAIQQDDEPEIVIEHEPIVATIQ